MDNPRLLIADDDADFRDFLNEELTNAGFSVTTVANGADAIVNVAEQTFDMILLDMMMPGMDGIQVIRVLKKIAPRLPVLGLSGYVGRGYMAQATDLNVLTLTKPVVISNLVEEINAALKTAHNG
jgi:CheY-like chemotaxis protein